MTHDTPVAKASRLTEDQKRSVVCPTCHVPAGKACRGSRAPGANTFGWPNLDRAHDARRKAALLAFLPADVGTSTPAAPAPPRSVILGQPSPSSEPVTWYVDGVRYTCPRESGVCPMCCKRAVVALPEPLRTIQPDRTTHVCVPSLGGCNHGFEDTRPVRHSSACMTTYLLSGDPKCPACGDEAATEESR